MRLAALSLIASGSLAASRSSSEAFRADPSATRIAQAIHRRFGAFGRSIPKKGSLLPFLPLVGRILAI
jgi:hypothetical protein